MFDNNFMTGDAERAISKGSYEPAILAPQSQAAVGACSFGQHIHASQQSICNYHPQNPQQLDWLLSSTPKSPQSPEPIHLCQRSVCALGRELQVDLCQVLGLGPTGQCACHAPRPHDMQAGICTFLLALQDEAACPRSVLLHRLLCTLCLN